jgi:hypothetical protein
VWFPESELAGHLREGLSIYRKVGGREGNLHGWGMENQWLSLPGPVSAVVPCGSTAGLLLGALSCPSPQATV